MPSDQQSGLRRSVEISRCIAKAMTSLAFVVFAHCVFAISAASATPPAPPARLILPEDLRGAEAQLSTATIPIRVQLRENVTNLRIKVTIRRMQPGKPDFDQPKPQTILDRTFADPKEFVERGVNIPINIRDVGESIIDITLRGRTGIADGFSDRIVRYLVVTPEGRAILLTPQERERRRGADKESRFNAELAKDPKSPPIRLLFDDTVRVPASAVQRFKAHSVVRERQLDVRAERPSEYILKNSLDSSATSWNSQDPITVRGRLLFLDIDDSWKPLVNAAVHLWDSEAGADDYLGSVATGWDGRWSLSVNNNDGWLQDGRDIYYTFKLDNTRWSVSSCSFLAGAYEWKSAVHNDLNDGTILDFGDETASTNTDALRVWSTINLAWNHASTVGGWDPGKVDVCFPGSGTFYDGRVNVEASDVDGPDSITHEYGHALMAHAYSGGDPSPGGDHGFGDCNQNQSLAWSEGWATGFMLSVRPDGRYNWHEGDAGRNIEGFASGCNPRVGEANEGWVAAAILDMFDGGNDDNGGNLSRGRAGYSDHNATSPVALATMLRDTMVGSHHNNVLEFWSSLSGELASMPRSLAQEIMYYDYMGVFPPNACVASKLTAQQSPDADTLLGRLRRFRDVALKNWAGGREWINVYYRHSPELAWLLLRKPHLLPDALRLMRHFADIGDMAAKHAAYISAVRQNIAVVPDDIASTVTRVIDALEPDASSELRADLGRVRQTTAEIKNVGLQELAERIKKEKSDSAGKPLPTIHRDAFTPASRKALDDRSIKDIMGKGLPPPPR